MPLKHTQIQRKNSVLGNFLDGVTILVKNRDMKRTKKVVQNNQNNQNSFQKDKQKIKSF